MRSSILSTKGRLGDVFLAYNGTMYAPISGILFVDFFLLRDQKLHLWSIFDDAPDGEYQYWKGFNWLALGCVVLALVCSVAHIIRFKALGCGGCVLWIARWSTLCMVRAYIHARMLSMHGDSAYYLRESCPVDALASIFALRSCFGSHLLLPMRPAHSFDCLRKRCAQPEYIIPRVRAG